MKTEMTATNEYWLKQLQSHYKTKKTHNMELSSNKQSYLGMSLQLTVPLQ